MNEIVNKFLLAGERFVPEMHLKQPGFTYSACRPFTENQKEFKNLKKWGIQNVFIEKNQKKLVFSMMWLIEIIRTASHKAVKDKAFNIAKNPKYDGN